jgi:hypothetical protein
MMRNIFISFFIYIRKFRQVLIILKTANNHGALQGMEEKR